MRCLGVHQFILDDKSPTLKTAVLQLIDECEYILYNILFKKKKPQGISPDYF